IVPDNGKDRTLLRQQVELVIYRQVKVAVATHTLDQGDVIAHGDFKMETRELDSDVEKFAPENLVGQRLIDRVDAGKPIYASQLRKTSTVRRGQSITLIHQTPGIVVRCKSTSLTDAEPGGRIKVRILLPSGKKTDIKEADVVDENTAVLAR
ncbi:MAG TPA: flagellar basal body P-ring formation chaperone FlgA, partial [Leptospiraceae bacterium]|nr:flagellar basal body P-ring formation chaperone FlgA [Leptospiraceae bacterium]